MASDPGTNQSVERAATILAAFLHGGPLRVSDVARQAGLGQSTTSRLLATLESLDYVEREPTSTLYRLGPALITLAGIAVNQNPVHREARQPAQNLAATLGMGVNIAERHHDSLFYLCNFEGRHAPRSSALMGQHNPLHATGLGKCLLLGLDPARRRTLLPDLRPYTRHTLTTHDELDDALDTAARHGYATETEELALGRACIAAPIRNRSGTVVAAISISGPLTTLDLAGREPDLAGTVIEVADSISVGLGYPGPPHTSPPPRQRELHP
ncbi:IclR family transcriptional regulator [Streptosporangium sp. KLBMP 9127]|nr:IclR family transcriptional regulator [Streptosporangium sp. KLBMP 9127]